MKHQLIYNIEGLNKQFKRLYRLEPQNIYEEIVFKNDNQSLTERTINSNIVHRLFNDFLLHRIHVIHTLPIHTGATYFKTIDAVIDRLMMLSNISHYNECVRRGTRMDVDIRRAIPTDPVVFSGRQVVKSAIINADLILELDR